MKKIIGTLSLVALVAACGNPNSTTTTTIMEAKFAPKSLNKSTLTSTHVAVGGAAAKVVTYNVDADGKWTSDDATTGTQAAIMGTVNAALNAKTDTWTVTFVDEAQVKTKLQARDTANENANAGDGVLTPGAMWNAFAAKTDLMAVVAPLGTTTLKFAFTSKTEGRTESTSPADVEMEAGMTKIGIADVAALEASIKVTASATDTGKLVYKAN